MTCCGKNFCEACIERVKKDKKPCPLCGKNFQAFPDQRLKRPLYLLRVYCSERVDGCGWSGELRDLDKHLEEAH